MTILSKTPVRRRAILAGVMAAIGLAGAASAYSLAHADPVDLTVINRESSQPIRLWRHHGRLFVAGETGARYSLRVTNHTGGRVLVVMSVDGVNIVSGETASYDQRGYVLDPYESYDVTGWRKSDSEVAAFAFAPLPRSYAARTGRPTDVGVIGMAVFEEKLAVLPPLPAPPIDEPGARYGASRDSAEPMGGAFTPPPMPAQPAPLAAAPPPAAKAYANGGATSDVVVTAQRRAEILEQRSEKLGTAHGAREDSYVSETTFVRSTTRPISTRQIEYDTYANLAAAGVIPTWRAEPRHPRPFPTNPDGEGFVPDPPEE
jgi:hypothetical protein